MKNQLGFLNNNIAGHRIAEKLNYLQWILLYWVIENSDYFKDLTFLFFDILFLFFTLSKSKWFSVRPFLIKTDYSYRKISPVSFLYTLSFLF